MWTMKAADRDKEWRGNTFVCLARSLSPGCLAELTDLCCLYNVILVMHPEWTIPFLISCS